MYEAYVRVRKDGATVSGDAARLRTAFDAIFRAILREQAGPATVVAERRDLTSEERLGDALFTGLRLNDGVELSRLSGQYETDIWQVYGERLAPYCDAGLLLKEGDRIRLTRQGMLMAHEVMAVFV